jgi:hypothetical protein
MSVASVARCALCNAIVNVHWVSCLVCGKSLAQEAAPLLAVKIEGSVIGDYWLVLNETEGFDPGDGLCVYRPSEIKALAGKDYEPIALQTIDDVKTIFNGTLQR